MVQGRVILTTADQYGTTQLSMTSNNS